MNYKETDKSVCVCVVRTPEGTIKLYCKGADVVILERSQKGSLHEDSTKQALEVSTDGPFTIFLQILYFFFIFFDHVIWKAYF